MKLKHYFLLATFLVSTLANGNTEAEIENRIAGQWELTKTYCSGNKSKPYIPEGLERKGTITFTKEGILFNEQIHTGEFLDDNYENNCYHNYKMTSEYKYSITGDTLHLISPPNQYQLSIPESSICFNFIKQMDFAINFAIRAKKEPATSSIVESTSIIGLTASGEIKEISFNDIVEPKPYKFQISDDGNKVIFASNNHLGECSENEDLVEEFVKVSP